jgi:2-oxoglutarate dehydrogenase complex dehydrogenase (E1) component-like enzyme
MYKVIGSKTSVPDAYAQQMVESGIMRKDEITEITQKRFDYYNSELQAVESYQPEKSYFSHQWDGFAQASGELTVWDTGMGWDVLGYIGRSSVYFPENFVS